MKDWKTTLAAALKVGVVIAGAFAIDIPDGTTENIVEFCSIGYGLFTLVQAYFTKDKPVPADAE